jgi:uncharacterized delta-60 repeat protein
MHIIKNYSKYVLITFTFLMSDFVVFGQAGSLDQSFGSNGIVTTAIGNGNDYGNSMVIQNDGKIVVVGTNGVNFALVRYNSDGTLDKNFGNEGKVSTSIMPGNAICNSVALQSDGKLVVSGYNGIFPNYDIVLARYDSNGILDNTFGNGGLVITSIGNAPIISNGLVIQNDGKILLTGNFDNGSNADVLVLRYNSNGNLDSTFDSDGIVITSIGPANEIGRAIAIQGDGKIIVTGYSYTPKSFAYEFFVLRYNINGSLDISFDNDGILTTDIIKENDYGEDIIIQADDKIIIAGYSFTGFLCLARYQSNGKYDDSFGNNGKVSIPFSSAYQNSYSAILQSDGKILVCGYSKLNGPNSDFAIARFTNLGKLDSSFGLDGIVTTPIGKGEDIATSIDIQKDGKIIVAGRSFNGTNYDFAIARYNNDNTSDKINLDYQRESFNIYPNPCFNILNLNSDKFLVDAEINVYNSNGIIVKQIANIYGNNFTLYNNNLSIGFYVIKIIQNEETVFIKNVIINE